MVGKWIETIYYRVWARWCDKTKKYYLSDFVVGDEECRPIIIITHNKCIFFTKNDVWRAWTQISDIFLWLKG